MKNTSLLFVLVFFFIVPKIQAQDQQLIDSLLQVYEDENAADTTKVKALKALFGAYLYYDQEKAGFYLEQGYELAVAMGDELNQSNCIGSKGILLEIAGELDSAKIYYNKAIAFYEKNDYRNKLELTRFNLAMIESNQGNYQEAIALVNQNFVPLDQINKENATSQSISYGLLSRAYRDQGYYQLALENALIALKLIKTTEDELRVADALNDLASVESNLAYYRKAIEYYQEAIGIYDQYGDKYYKANVLNNVGSTYIVLEEYPNAIKVLNQGLKLTREVGALDAAFSILTNLGQAHTKQGDVEQALKYFKEAITISDSYGFSGYLAQTHLYLGELYYQSNQYVKALSYLRKSIASADSTGQQHLSQDGYYYSSKILRAMGDFDAAFQDYEKFHKLSQEIYDEQQITAIEELRIMHDLEQKENEIELLAEKAEVEKLKKNRLWLLLISAIVFGCLLVFVQWQRRKKAQLIHEKEQEIAQQKRKVAELENQKLNHELDFKKQELSSKVLQICRKNEFLQSLQKELADYKKELQGADKNYLDKMSRKINRDINASSDWEQFLKSFENIHPDFKKLLLQKYPTLAPNEIRMAYLMRMNLETKDIANLLNITTDGVKKARYRMRKKMGQDSAVNLTEYFMQLGM